MHQIIIQQHDFNVADCQQWLVDNSQSVPGAIVTFTGLVRDYNSNANEPIIAIELEHYQGMTERLIEDIVEQAAQRWQLNAMMVIHRIGYLKAAEQIVYVGAASAHRADAFNACHYIMDYLKTEATLWKKEYYGKGQQRWLDCKQSDQQATEKWR